MGCLQPGAYMFLLVQESIRLINLTGNSFTWALALKKQLANTTSLESSKTSLLSVRMAYKLPFLKVALNVLMIESYRRATEAWKNDAFKAEIAPVTIPSRKGDVVMTEDEEFKNINVSQSPRTLDCLINKCELYPRHSWTRLNPSNRCSKKKMARSPLPMLVI